jgi:hypothetical protein
MNLSPTYLAPTYLAPGAPWNFRAGWTNDPRTAQQWVNYHQGALRNALGGARRLAAEDIQAAHEDVQAYSTAAPGTREYGKALLDALEAQGHERTDRGVNISY